MFGIVLKLKMISNIYGINFIFYFLINAYKIEYNINNKFLYI